MPARISLQVPDKPLLDAYQAALRGGWSPNTTRNVAPDQLAAIAADPNAFLAEIRGGPGRVKLPDGREVDRIPGPTRWIFADRRESSAARSDPVSGSAPSGEGDAVRNR